MMVLALEFRNCVDYQESSTNTNYNSTYYCIISWNSSCEEGRAVFQGQRVSPNILR